MSETRTAPVYGQAQLSRDNKYMSRRRAGSMTDLRRKYIIELEKNMPSYGKKIEIIPSSICVDQTDSAFASTIIPETWYAKTI